MSTAASDIKPYSLYLDDSFYNDHRGVQLYRLQGYKVSYVTKRGGYTALCRKELHVSSVSELLAAGHEEIQWDGRGFLVFVDEDDVVVSVMIGKPHGLSKKESEAWDSQCRSYAREVERTRQRHEDALPDKVKLHGRGDFTALSFGIWYGNGIKEPANFVQKSRAEKDVVTDSLGSEFLQQRAARASDMLALFFPLAFEHLREHMRALHTRHPRLQFNFEGSMYPTCALNMGPRSVSICHTDGNNYPGLPCSIDVFGDFDWRRGGHLVLMQFKIFVRFPPGCLALLSSAGIQHGNTPVGNGERRYSFTQFVPGDLIRWIAYGCKPASGISPEDKERLDATMGEGWHAQRGRLSRFFDLPRDRRSVFERQNSM